MKSIPNLDYLLDLNDPNAAIMQIDDAIVNLSDNGDNITVLSDPQRTFFFNQLFEKEINNGGFRQYFFNSCGGFAHQTVASLELVGARKTADLLKHAIDLFPEALVPVDLDARRQQLTEIEDLAESKWELLEQEFYEYEENLNILNLEFVKRNRLGF